MESCASIIGEDIFRGYNGNKQVCGHISQKSILFPDGIGNNGSDFTVGAVLLKKGMGNFFKGQIGGLAVFDRFLSEKELLKLSKLD